MSSLSHWKSKTKPFSSPAIQLEFTVRLTEEEIVNARAGLLPENMDDKWLGFATDLEIGFFRSWTGSQIYRLPIILGNGDYEVGPLEVADDPTVYRRTDDATDLKMAALLITKLVSGKCRPSDPGSNSSCAE